MPLAFTLSDLPHVNGLLNLAATLLLVLGFALIKQRREAAHRNAMLAAFGVSTVFLASYLLHMAVNGSRRFPGEPPISYLYFSILISHMILAATVPVLTITTIYLGLKDHRPQHLRWAKWTFPIWLYVSVTGVVIYLMLYQLYP
jgi:uncharacterized membrane protein YozB (DUF420 family)